MRFKCFLTAFSTVAIFFLLTAGAMAAPGGEKPTKYYWEDEFGDPAVYDDTFLFCDGFDVNIYLEWGGWWMVHPGTPGKGNWESYFSFSRMKVYNASNPDLYMDGVPGGKWNRKWTGTAHESDYIETGVQLMLTIPHYGILYRDVGRVVIDIKTWMPIVSVGHWDAYDGIDEDDLIALCEVLAE